MNIDDARLKIVLDQMQRVSNDLAMEGRFDQSMVVAGGIQVIRAWRTALEPVAAEAPGADADVAPEKKNESP